MPEPKTPTVILGSAGYVAGELLRLLAFHPTLQLVAAVSRSQEGRLISDPFPHLLGVHDDQRFVSFQEAEEILSQPGPVALFSCLPHGEGAQTLDELMTQAERRGSDLRVVDLSADFRLPDPHQWAEVYGHEHGAPRRCSSFTCALPELTRGVPTKAIAHPGCFTTATTLALAPLMSAQVAEPSFFVSAVTGSTGSGQKPTETTHHPARHGNLRAYRPLQHRHVPEMEMLLGRLAGENPEVNFVPHSGPFARGIHGTIHARLLPGVTGERILELYRGFYEGQPFVGVSEEPPSLKEVVGTNRCRLGVVVQGHHLVVLSTIDNLTKGAAGGAVQWMNRLLQRPEAEGLRLPGLGWN